MLSWTSVSSRKWGSRWFVQQFIVNLFVIVYKLWQIISYKITVQQVEVMWED